MTVDTGATVPTVTPNQPKTPLRSFRCPDELWDAAKAKAHEERETVTDVLVRALRAYVD